MCMVGIIGARHNRGMSEMTLELAQAAAALVVDEGLPYGAAKQRAVQALGLPRGTPLPDNNTVEAAVREHIAIFHADTQPVELQALRTLALDWMRRFSDFQPLVGGAVWHGTATARSDVHLQLFSDDPKAIEIDLLNQGLAFDAQRTQGFHGREVDVLTLEVPCPPLDQRVGVHLWVNDTLAMRGALLPDSQGRKPRGDTRALSGLVNSLGDGGGA